MADRELGKRLDLALKSLNLSNGRLAADLAVDKSLVGRWILGSVMPSAHNLTRLTTHLAARIPGLSPLDWELPLHVFRERLTPGSADRQGGTAPFPCPEASIDETRRWGPLYAGRWRMWHFAASGARTIVHYHLLFELTPDGGLTTRFAYGEIEMHGWARVYRQQLLMWTIEPTAGNAAFAALNGLNRPSDRLLAGILGTMSYNQPHTPFAAALVLERVASDGSADDDWLALCGPGYPVVTEAEVPAYVLDILLVDSGPVAHAAGAGAMTLRVPPPLAQPR